MLKSRLLLLAVVLVVLAALLTVLGAGLPPAVPVAARWLALAAIAAAAAPRRSLTLWIVVSMLVGIELGHDAPGVAMSLKVLSDAFLRLVKTIIAPLVFATLVVGIAGHADLKQVGRMGIKALVYFEIVTTFALFIGLAAINLTKAGVGISRVGVKEEALAAAPTQTAADIILHIFRKHCQVGGRRPGAAGRDFCHSVCHWPGPHPRAAPPRNAGFLREPVGGDV